MEALYRLLGFKTTNRARKEMPPSRADLKSIDELVRMVAGENDGAFCRHVTPPYHVHLFNKRKAASCQYCSSRKSRVEQYVGDFTTCTFRSGCNVPVQRLQISSAFRKLGN